MKPRLCRKDCLEFYDLAFDLVIVDLGQRGVGNLKGRRQQVAEPAFISNFEIGEPNWHAEHELWSLKLKVNSYAVLFRSCLRACLE